MTQRQLATRAGIHNTYLSRIEAGRENPSWRVVGELADALGIRMSELVAAAETYNTRRRS